MTGIVLNRVVECHVCGFGYRDGGVFTCDDCKANQNNESLATLNELAQLRADNAALVKMVEEFSAVFDQWWDHYTTQQPNANKQDGWGWIDEAWDRLKEAAGIKPDTKGGE